MKNSGHVTKEVELWYEPGYSDRHKDRMTLDNLLPEGRQTDFANSYDYNVYDFKKTLNPNSSISTTSRRKSLRKII